MKDIKVINSKLSKKGISTNFHFNGIWHSVKNSILKKKNIEIEGKIIEISEYKLSGSWVMIKNLNIQNEIVARESKHNIKNNPSNQSYDSHISMTRKLNENKNLNNQIIDFSPIELMNAEFSSSTREISFKVNFVNSLKNIKRELNPFCSVIQNLINRGNNIQTNNEKCDPFWYKKS